MASELKRILISDEVDQKCIDVFEKNGIKAVKKTKLTKDELIKEIQGYDGLIVRSATKVTKVSFTFTNLLLIRWGSLMGQRKPACDAISFKIYE